MANKDWDLEEIDFYNDECNCKQYKEEEYKRDLKRYLELNDWFEKAERNGEEYYICNNVDDYKKCCEKCAFYCKAPRHQLYFDFAFTSFDTIKKIFVWALKHPVTTNADKLKEVFGKDYGALIASKMSQGWQSWLEEEYKEPDDEELK